jgi:peptide/nickel transport system substrate-binding protein
MEYFLSRRGLIKVGVGLSVAAVASGVLAACGSGGGGGGKAPAASPEDALTKIIPKEERKLAPNQKLVMRGYAEPVGFDPAKLFQIATEVIALQIYEGLTDFEPMTGKPTPGLAESWKVSPDGLTYTFHLRKGVQWHLGYGEFTADDVLYTYNRVLDPKTGSAYRLDMANIQSMTAPDKYTVVFKLGHPEANFLMKVTNNHQGQIVKKEAVEKFGADYPRHPVGTGPFYLESWTPQSNIVLKRHQRYWAGAADLEQVTWELMVDSTAAETAITKGEVDVAHGLNSFTTEQFETVRKTPGISIATSWANLGSNWLFGPDFKPFQDVRVRRAFIEALDNATIAKQVTPTGYLGGTSIVPPWMAEYDSSIKPIPYDPEDAKKLLKEAGYENGFKVKMLLGAAPSETAVLQQSYLAKVGIKMTFDVQEPPTYNAHRQNGTMELSYRGYPAINIDTLLSGYLDSRYAAPNGFNTTRLNDPKLDQMLKDARSEMDEQKRYNLYRKIEQYANDNVYYPAFGFGSMSIAHKDEIKNVQPNRLCTFKFYDMYRSA